VIGLLWALAQLMLLMLQAVAQALHHRVLYQALLAAQRLLKRKCRSTSTEHGDLLRFIQAVVFQGLIVRVLLTQGAVCLTAVRLMTAQQITVHGPLVVARVLEARKEVLEQLQSTATH
jgi:hypothetical protein